MPQAEAHGGASPDELCLWSRFSNQAARVKDCEEGLARRLQQPLYHNPPPGQPFLQSLQNYRRVCISLTSKTTATVTLFLPLPPPFLPVLLTLIINIKRSIRKQMHNSLVFVI